MRECVMKKVDHVVSSDLQFEEWRPIPGWEMYEVSDKCRVRRNGTIRKSWMVEGRPTVELKDKPRKLRSYICRFMLMAFVRLPLKGEEARHLDDDVSNNDLNNLAWGTHTENSQDLIRNGRGRKGEKHPLARLTEKEVLEIRDLFRPYNYTRKMLAKEYGI